MEGHNIVCQANVKCSEKYRMATRVNRFFSFFFTDTSMACVFSLCETLIKNINNGACRWAKGMPATKGQQTSFGPGYNSLHTGRMNLFQILKHVFYRTCRSNHKKGFGSRPL